MRFLRGLLFLLQRLIQALLWGWATGLQWLLQMLRILWARLRAQLAKSERERRTTEDRCVPVRHPAIQRPDPLIYSQSYLMGLGLAVTWDNPDIQLYEGGVPVSSSALKRATEYEIEARIWNGSTEAPVAGLPVRFTLHGFGIATAGTLIDATTVPVLGVKGGANCPVFAKVKWTTPASEGHYCIQAHLDWPDDSNPNNNVGQENTNVLATASPGRETFTLRNDDRARRHRYHFEVDAYTLPEREPCAEAATQAPTGLKAARLWAGRARDSEAVGLVDVSARVRERHDRAQYPIPAGWRAEVNPAELVLAPHAEAEIEVVVEPPPGFQGEQLINVNAFDEAGFAGGVTFVVQSA